MPLHHGKSKKDFGENIAIERKHGKPEKQAVAIAYSEKGEAEKKDDECKHCGSKHHKSHGHKAKHKALERMKK